MLFTPERLSSEVSENIVLGERMVPWYESSLQHEEVGFVKSTVKSLILVPSAFPTLSAVVEERLCSFSASTDRTCVFHVVSSQGILCFTYS